MLLVSCQGNSRLLLVTFWGCQKLNKDFRLYGRLAPQPSVVQGSIVFTDIKIHKTTPYCKPYALTHALYICFWVRVIKLELEMKSGAWLSYLSKLHSLS